MSLLDLPDDILIHIYSFLDTNNTISMSKTCTRINKLYSDMGCVKELNYGNSKMNIHTFYRIYIRNIQSIKKVTLNEMSDPDKWIMKKWPEYVCFNNCSIDAINPNSVTNTKALIVKDYHRSNTKKKLYINWMKFPKLTVLDLYTHDVNLEECIEKCKYLEYIRINTCQEKILPSKIAELKYLKFIVTTCVCYEKLHFVSESLFICFVAKKDVEFTSNSKKVPDNHLIQNGGFINTECFDPMEYYF